MNLSPHHRPLLYAFSLCLMILTSCDQRQDKISEELKVKLNKLDSDTTDIQKGPLINTEVLLAVYDTQEEVVAGKWGNKQNVEDMLSIIRDVKEHGLNPTDYHLESLQKLATIIFESDSAEAEDYADLDLLLTDAFFLISHHLAQGKTDPETIDPQWKASRRFKPAGLKEHIDSTLNNNAIKNVLISLAPRHQYYQNLKIALEKYIAIEANGGWEPFTTEAKKLEMGMTHPDVAALRKRLIITQGDPYSELKEEEYFDSLLHDQVVIFQKRNGIPADGKVGKSTIEALNIPVRERIASIEVNLERWRWLKDDLGDRYVLVNIANFDMEVIENGEQVFYSEAIVGKPYRKTPVFSSRMSYMVFAPTWTVPPTILNQDVIPAVRKDPGYLSKMNMKVYDRNNNPVDPSSINWKNTANTGFPYKIVQAPGKNNALGDVKFMFPNEYNVYIHDTPTRNLFSETERSLSSGCIRIRKPLEFASFLLSDQPEWSMERIKKVVQQGKENRVNIKKPLPVHIIYLTTWADDSGTVHFRKDIYDRDTPLLRALMKKHGLKIKSLICKREIALTKQDGWKNNIFIYLLYFQLILLQPSKALMVIY